MVPVLLSIAFGAGSLPPLRVPDRPAPGPRRAPAGRGRGGCTRPWPGPACTASPRATSRSSPSASGAVAGVVAQLLLGWGLVSLLAAGLGLRRAGRLLRPAARPPPGRGAGAPSSRRSPSCATGSAAACRSRRPWPPWPAAGRRRCGEDFARLVRELRLAGLRSRRSRRCRSAWPTRSSTSSPATLLLNDRLGGRNASAPVLDRLARRDPGRSCGSRRSCGPTRPATSCRRGSSPPCRWSSWSAIRQLNPAYLAVFDDLVGSAPCWPAAPPASPSATPPCSGSPACRARRGSSARDASDRRSPCRCRSTRPRSSRASCSGRSSRAWAPTCC